MFTQRTLFLSAAIALLPVTLSAQGELGFGEAEDATQSLAERVANIEQKFKAFNVYVNFNGNFHTQSQSDLSNTASAFEAKNLRLELKGQIGNHFYYRVRQRLNKSNAALRDGLSKATDIAMIGYRFNPQWLVSVGKMGQYFGGFEFDQNAIYVYRASDINDCADGSKFGVAVTYNPVPTQTFVAQVTNAYNDHLDTEFPHIADQGIRPSDHPLTYVAHWSGSFASGLYRTKTSYVRRTLARDNASNVLVIGQSINGSWGRVFLDYAYERDDFDYMRFSSAEASNYLGPNQYCLTDLSYHGLVARTDVKLGRHVIAWAEGMYQTANCNSVAELHDYRKHYCYMAGLEIVPNPDYKVRYTINYQGQRYDYSSRSGLPSYSTNRIEVGILCRLKCF